MAEIVRGMPAESYHALPALSASGAHLLARECPAQYWHTSPFNPEAEVEPPKDHFDIGAATHLLLLEPDEFAARTVIVDADSYTAKAARAARDNARNAGLTPLLTKNLAMVEAMARAIRADPVAGRAFAGGGDTEVTMTWTDPEFEIPCKLRIDWLPNDLTDLRDLKTAASANPLDFESAAWDHGYPQRAAWYLDGVEAVTGKRPRFYWFVAVEKKAPWLVTVLKYTEADIEWGRILNTRAKALFAECRASGQWPGYRPPGATRPRAFDIRLPRWAVWELQERSERGADLGQPRSAAEIERATTQHRRAARLIAPTMDRDYLP